MKTATDLEFDIAQLGELILDLKGQKNSLSNALMPYWSLRKQLHEQIRESFLHNGVVRFAFNGKHDRRCMYEELICLAEEYGELAEQHREVNAEMEAAIRQRKRLLLRLERMQRAGELF